MDNLNSLVEFFIEVNNLKKTIRYSPCVKEVQEPVAGHVWKISLMIPLLVEELKLDINVLRAMEIAIVHDLAEYVDEEDFDSHLVATGVLSKEEKNKSEEATMINIKEKFSFGSKIYDLWKEYEDANTPEAKFVKALDKLESHLHVIERGGTGENPKSAMHQALYANKAVKNFPELKPFLREVKKELKPLLEKQGLIWKPEYNYPD